ncbi:related to multidrug resistance protein [Melanopsichium pennsylvanicum]|uniref:Related to multidrug resistance protein n=2 Tax=Melanopsichium pennsylvanicum TaxID=63383 RepID=A0AAJ5C3R7_9BASI|nr:related to multidrug resistance protein [Melanopsichium pennsylvanicum 4]SNX82862.1 related to multidrug resistance protein [Melanopsichium pennsylvanicum]
MPDVTETTPLAASPSNNGHASPPSYGATPNSGASTPVDESILDQYPKGLKFAIIIGSLWVVLFMAALDGTIVVTLISSISSSFKASEKSGWLSSSYLLSVCAFSSIYGRLSDIVGRKGALLIALTFFTTGTCLCAVAKSMDVLLVARFVAGIGGGGLLTTSSICMTDLVPLRQRGLWQGITNILFGSASALGGPLGGFINDAFGWRTAFGFQVPFLLIGAVCIGMFVNIPIARSDQSWQMKLGRIDFLGSLGLISSSSCLLLAMSFLSGSLLPFSHPLVWGFLLGFLVTAIFFVLVEGWVVKEPVMPLSLLTRKSPALIGASYFLGSFAHFATIFHFPLWFQSVRLQSASQAGLHLIPVSFSAAAGSLWAGLYMKKKGKYWHANVFCCMLNIVSTAYGATWTESTSGWAEFVTFCPQAFGTSAIFTFMLIGLIASVSKEKAAVATGTVYLFRSLGQVVGVSLSTALFQMMLESQMWKNITSDLLKHPQDGAEGVKKLISALRHDASLVPKLQPEALRHAAQVSYMNSIKWVFTTVSVLNILYMAVCWPVEEYELSEKPATAFNADELNGQAETRPDDSSA